MHFQVIDWNILSSNQIARFCNHQYLLSSMSESEGISQYLKIFFMENVTIKNKLLRLLFLVECGQACTAVSILGKVCQRCFWVKWGLQAGKERSKWKFSSLDPYLVTRLFEFESLRIFSARDTLFLRIYSLVFLNIVHEVWTIWVQKGQPQLKKIVFWRKYSK